MISSIQTQTQTERITNLKLESNKKIDTNKQKKKKPIKKVTWTEDTVDNEHMGKMKSNICCIFTPPADKRIETCSSDDNNELERSEESKRDHLNYCSKIHNH